MVMHRGKPLTCKRPGCDASRESGHLVCASCWTDIQYPTRQRYLRAKRRRLTKIAADLGRNILRTLGRKPEETPPTQAFAQIATLTGDRDQLEPAE